MAKLISGNLALEIRFKELDEHNWVQYEIFFLYQDEPMVQNSQLKVVNEHWRNRTPGAFKANEHKSDDIVGVFQKALDSGEPQFYEPTDPDIILAIYPYQTFPFISKNPRVEENDLKMKSEMTDNFTVILMVDTYNYGDEHGYSGEGPALVMLPYRDELITFVNSLKTEYCEFCEQWGITP